MKDTLDMEVVSRYNERMEKEASTKKEKSLIPLTRVNKDRLSPESLRRRVRTFEDDPSTVREICNAAWAILKHRDGTYYEDLAFVDSARHKCLINRDYDFYDEGSGTSACKPNKPMMDLLSEAGRGVVIAIHNHPQSAVLSIDDINRFVERGYKYALVLCHDGTIFRYEVGGMYSIKKSYLVLAQLDKLRKSLYNGDDEKKLSALKNLKEKGVVVEVIA